VSRLEKLDGVSFRRDVRLSALTSFGVGGPADVLAVAGRADGLAGLLELARQADAKVFVMGAGTNVLFDDAGYRGVVLKLGGGFGAVAEDQAEEGRVTAGAAVQWSDVTAFCLAHSLSGLQQTAGIPGTVGGALAGNAGAFGVAVGDRVAEVTGYDSEGRERKLRARDVRFDYRRADFGCELVLTGATLVLAQGERDALGREVAEILARRREKQPLEFPSAGSVFKNPQGGKAGRLIDEAGLKGRRMGGAQVSEKHANFIVNTGGAKAGDVLALIELVREEVWRRFSVKLELEVKVVT
jgi:UDP-N-acetylmuramate dehydrogenase